MIELWAAFVLGLAGSLHCAGMCGPIALAIPANDRRHFLLGRILYNAGRIVSYSLLGLIFGALGASLALAGLQRWLSITVGAGLIILLFVSRRQALTVPFARAVAHLKGSFARCLKSHSLGSVGVLGILNGFLPCGLAYAAAAAATATGSWLRAVEFMIAFGVGTVPMMLAIGIFGQKVQWRLRFRFEKLMPVSVIVLALLLVLRGLSLGIPYISPGLSGRCPHCH
jgi:uncharacterized protein